MNVINVVGGELLLLGAAYLAAIVLLSQVTLWWVAKAFLYVLGAASVVTATGCGLAILSGGSGPLGYNTAQWAVAFVSSQLVGLWGFNLAMAYRVLKGG